MAMEIDIHQSLSHANVVGFHGFFEDKNHVYILLELCRRRLVQERRGGGRERRERERGRERGKEGGREGEGEREGRRGDYGGTSE